MAQPPTERAILERRLKPIYDALDNDNSKKALQEAERVLQKHPGTVCAKILKALSLLRLERLREGMAIIDSLDVEGAKFDESSLQALCHCYKEAEMPERICKLYERVVTYAPTESNYCTLFLAFVRMKNFKRQHDIASKMFKEFGKVPHAFWDVMSVVMQGMERPQLAGKMFFPLALRMIETQLKKETYKASGEVEMHVMVLEGLGRFEEAELILSNPDVSSRFLQQPVERTVERRLNLLHRCGKYLQVVDQCISWLKDDVDNWTLWTLLFDSLFAILVSNSTTEDSRSAIISKVVKFISDRCDADSVQQNGSANEKDFSSTAKRGPYLARLEFLKRIALTELSSKEDLVSIFSDAAHLMVDYIRKFFTKPCCYADISLYICLLDESKIQFFNGQLEKFVIECENNSDLAQDDICKARFVFESLRRRFGITSRFERAEKRKIFANIISCVSKPNVSEQIAGQLVVVAVSILWEMFTSNNDYQAFWELILCLEWASLEFKAEPFIKIVLLRAYSIIVVLNRMIALVKSLDVKSVQRDTLGYILFPMFELCGRFNLGVMHCTELAGVYSAAERETSECLIGGYRNGTFAQIPRIVELLNRIEKSSLASAAELMNRYFSSLFIIQDKEEQITTLNGDDEWINWSDKYDNRDLNILKSTDPGDTRSLLEDMRRITHQEFIDGLHLRESLCKMIAAIGNTQVTTTELRHHFEVFEKHLDICRKVKEYQSGYKESMLMQSPSPIHISAWVNDGALDPIRHLFNVVIECTEEFEKARNMPCAILPTEDALKTELEVLIPSPIDITKPFNIHSSIILSSRALQSLAATRLILNFMIKRSQSFEASVTVKGKGKDKARKEEKPSQIEEHCLKLNKVVSLVAQQLASTMATYATQLNDPANGLLPVVGNDLPEAVRELLLKPSYAVRDRIVRSYTSSLDDMQETITTIFK